MVGDPEERYPREGRPLGRSVDNQWFGVSYSTQTPRVQRLWWRIRTLLRRPVRSHRRTR
jgi:hypothetical protein